MPEKLEKALENFGEAIKKQEDAAQAARELEALRMARERRDHLLPPDD